MARRKNISLQKRTKFQRKEATKETLKLFLIACEGKATEPKYLTNLLDTKRKDKSIAFGSDIIIATHRHSDPCGVLKDLMADPNYDSSDERWIVIDRDPADNFGKGAGGHTEVNFNEAIKKSKQNGVHVAWSNPCFEIWIILHFMYRDTACSRKDIQTRALELLQQNKMLESTDNIESMKSCENLYEKLKNNLDAAINNGERLIKINGKDFENPCTMVGELVKQLK